MTNMRICLTGAAGFIGSHLADRLLSRGDVVVGLDNFCDFYDPAVKMANLSYALDSGKFWLIEGDVRDDEAVSKAVYACDAVVHLAAMPGVRPSFECPGLYQDVNIGGTVRVLEACAAHAVTNVVFASSSSVYGNNRKVPFAEDDSVDRPVSIYAATKKAGELLCHTYSQIYEMDIACLRLFTVYGPRQRPDLAVHKFTRLIESGARVPVFGDGSMERDHTYIDDVVDGITAAIDTNRSAGYRVINLGSDHPVRLDDMLSGIEQALGKRARILRKPVPPGDVTRTWADLTVAKRELGYSPTVPFGAGIGRFVDWYRNGAEQVIIPLGRLQRSALLKVENA